MALRQVLDQVRRMESDGIVARYAIGGAVGATIYLEPAARFDVDIFVVSKSRLLQFVESGVMNPERFASIVSRHGLGMKWKLFKSQFLGQE